ncbi:MAG: hypothetical protein SPI30_02760 [Prevotella sp.]|nr:hypothetical protein [Prevotella sp.]
MNEKHIILAARILSIISTPFYLPLLGLLALFGFSYLNMLPFGYKLRLLLIVYAFTILLPTFLIHLYRRYQGWSHFQLGLKERRMIPYVISILCYYLCFYIMNTLHVPYFMTSILIAALLIQVVCAIINVYWKVSTHTAGIGGAAGTLQAFAFLFSFNPTWWLCFVLILAGMVGTSRVILRQHTLAQVVAGFFIGMICAGFAVFKLSVNLII